MTPAQFTAIKTKCGLSQSKLVKLLGKSIRTISRYETGKTSIPMLVARFMLEQEQKERQL